MLTIRITEYCIEDLNPETATEHYITVKGVAPRHGALPFHERTLTTKQTELVIFVAFD